MLTLRVDETWRAADSINAADAAAAAAAAAAATARGFSFITSRRGYTLKLQVVTPRGPKRVEIEISLL